MGNRSSSSSSSSEIKVALIGLTETGKSHFLGVVGDAVLPSHPTHGTEEITITHGKQQLRFTELGACIGESWAALFEARKFDCVMWFIDQHDTFEEICEGRNRLLHAVVPSSSSAPHTKTFRQIPLCIIQNRGRSLEQRRSVEKIVTSRGNRSKYVWLDLNPAAEGSSSSNGGVSWERLPSIINIDHLSSVHTGVYLTQLSYTDDYALNQLLDWIVASSSE